MADMHPPSNHPPPWAVVDNVHGGNGVCDADGVLVIGIDDPWQNLEFMDDYAQALVLASPEIEALLRENPTVETIAADPETGEIAFDMCSHCGDDADHCNSTKGCWGARVRAMLLWLDSRKPRVSGG